MYFLRSLAGILLGMALMTLIFTTLLDYDPLRRYQAAMAAHRDNKEFGGGLVQIYQTFIINNLEYAILTGLPLVISVIYQTLASFTRYLGRQAEQIDLFAAYMFLIYLGLNALGRTRGRWGASGCSWRQRSAWWGRMG